MTITDSNDIALKFRDEKLYIDVLLNADGSDLLGAFNLENSIIISLFTNRRTGADDEIPNSAGWVGDTVGIKADDDPLSGSKLWTFQLAKTTANRLIDAEAFCSEALNWMITDLIVANFEIVASFSKQFINVLFLDIDATMPDGEELRYQFAWDQIKNRLVSRNA